SVEPNAPTGCDYLRAHLVFDRRTQRSIRKIGGFNRFFANLIFADAESSRQIASCLLNCLLLIRRHRQTKSKIENDQMTSSVPLAFAVRIVIRDEICSNNISEMMLKQAG